MWFKKIKNKKWSDARDISAAVYNTGFLEWSD